MAHEGGGPDSGAFGSAESWLNGMEELQKRCRQRRNRKKKMSITCEINSETKNAAERKSRIFVCYMEACFYEASDEASSAEVSASSKDPAGTSSPAPTWGCGASSSSAPTSKTSRVPSR